MYALLAALPIVVLIVLLLGLRVSAARSAWSALALTLVLVTTIFPLEPTQGGLVHGLTGATAEGLFIAATIVWILLPALAIHELQQRSGAFEVLHEALTVTAREPTSKALLIGWFFALFLEGAAGFGTPIAVAGPMLVALGMSPVAAVTAALLGHVAGVAFGAVGTPILATAELSGIAATSIARQTIWLMLPVIWLAAIFLLRVSAIDSGRRWRSALMAAALFAIPYALAAAFIGPELPTLAGAMIGGAAFVALLRQHRPQRDKASMRFGALLFAATPYLIAIGLILATRLIEPIKSAVTGMTFGWRLYGDFTGSWLPLYHPGSLLFAALVITALVKPTARRVLATSLLVALRRLSPAIVALVAMLTLSRLMVHSGMIAALGDTAVGAGALWPFAAPAIGVLGSFVTGSATASNVLFTSLQQQAAASLGFPVVLMLSAQCVGAAIGNALCPHNIIAGAAAAGAAGSEGEILRRTLPACLLMLLLVGLLTMLLVYR